MLCSEKEAKNLMFSTYRKYSFMKREIQRKCAVDQTFPHSNIMPFIILSVSVVTKHLRHGCLYLQFSFPKWQRN